MLDRRYGIPSAATGEGIEDEERGLSRTRRSGRERCQGFFCAAIAFTAAGSSNALA